MRRSFSLWCTVAAGLCGMTVRPVLAVFHLVQIEQVIGGVTGDTSAQAIQLRLRSPGENLLEGARLRAWDADGENPITLIDFMVSVPNARLGDRVLVASTALAMYVDQVIGVDFTMTNLIPESYLTAGRLTYEGDNGAIYWSLSFGGSAYTGPTTATAVNDVDGEFGPPFDGVIPSSGLQGLLFEGVALDPSTTNLDDYVFTSDPAVFTNNAGQSATIVSCALEIDLDVGTDLGDFALFHACLSDTSSPLNPCCETADFNDDQAIDLMDYALLGNAFLGP